MMLSLEKNEDLSIAGFQPFVDGHLRSYSELLILTRDSVMSKARMDLPFFYTIPVISWIISLFRAKKKAKSSQAQQTQVTVQPENEEQVVKRHKSREEALADQAKALAEDFIPEGSTLDRELNFLTKQWNKLITKDANLALTEDVNSLIRDYRVLQREMRGMVYNKGCC